MKIIDCLYVENIYTSVFKKSSNSINVWSETWYVHLLWYKNWFNSFSITAETGNSILHDEILCKSVWFSTKRHRKWLKILFNAILWCEFYRIRQPFEIVALFATRGRLLATKVSKFPRPVIFNFTTRYQISVPTEG